ncbi:hypothetical protein Scep_019165 [Stephania cephalantha]|uniref:Uncharacterized protein n=1 Tax=Stephania cephalantha TaxID=152367 RepID=A0AAP0IBA9_9MAGN
MQNQTVLIDFIQNIGISLSFVPLVSHLTTLSLFHLSSKNLSTLTPLRPPAKEKRREKKGRKNLKA